ncbi:Potassium channel [Paramarasmius palmivorus]|uniref:Potassium channel n=1 Tax=Paramarasmius palmivorus TaxID=297713 RepID=A0AAW0D5N8_9AGAR
MLLPLNLGFQVLASRRDPEKGEADHSNSSNEDVEDSPTNNESGSGSGRRNVGMGMKEDIRPPQWYRKLKSFLFPPNNDDIDSYVPTYRYTPIISGLVIPFSILLEIPGLTEHWYIRTIENEVVETKPNTPVLNVGLAISMTCGVIANIALIVRFLEKRVKLMTVTCVAFLTIHDIINITAVTVFGVEHRFDDGFTYGTSFWMTLCSTIASTFTNATLIVDLIRTPDFASSGEQWAHKETAIAYYYRDFAALLHSLWSIDLLHPSRDQVCRRAVPHGFGDIVPVTTGARVFTCTYATFGVINLALAVALARETVIEALEVGYRRRLKTVRERRKRTRWVRRVSNRWREAIEWRLREADKPIWARDDPDMERTWYVRVADWLAPWMWPRTTRLGDVPHPHGMHLNLEALTDAQLEAAALEAGVPLRDLLPPGFLKRRKSTGVGRSRNEQGGSGLLWFRRMQTQRDVDPDQVPLTHARIGRMAAMLGSFALAVGKSEWFKDEKRWSKRPPIPDERARSSRRRVFEQDFDAYRAGMEEEERKAFWAKFSVAWMLFIVFWMIGSGVFMATEGWSFGEAMYFCFISFTTIGYGDFSPKTPAGRSIFVVWALFGVATMTILISVVSEAFTSRYKDVFRIGVFTRAVEKLRAKEQEDAIRRARSKPAPSVSGEGSSTAASSRSSANDHAKRRLEQLPRQIIQHCKSFHDHMQFVSSPRRIDGKEQERMPVGIQKLLDEIDGVEKLENRIKNEILQDLDARQTLFTLSIERELRKMLEAAEEALAALDERDKPP